MRTIVIPRNEGLEMGPHYAYTTIVQCLKIFAPFIADFIVNTCIIWFQGYSHLDMGLQFRLCLGWQGMGYLENSSLSNLLADHLFAKKSLRSANSVINYIYIHIHDCKLMDDNSISICQIESQVSWDVTALHVCLRAVIFLHLVIGDTVQCVHTFLYCKDS